jgi:hypothetical protein
MASEGPQRGEKIARVAGHTSVAAADPIATILGVFVLPFIKDVVGRDRVGAIVDG